MPARSVPSERAIARYPPGVPETFLTCCLSLTRYNLSGYPLSLSYYVELTDMLSQYYLHYVHMKISIIYYGINPMFRMLTSIVAPCKVFMSTGLIVVLFLIWSVDFGWSRQNPLLFSLAGYL